MTIAAVVVTIGIAGVGGWLWRIQRDLADLRSGVGLRTDVQVDAHLRNALTQLDRTRAQQARAVEARLRAIETAAAHSAVRQAQLARRVGAIEQWVRLRAAETRKAER